MEGGNPKWRSGVVGSEVAQMAAAGSGSSEAEGDLLVSGVGVLHTARIVRI